MPAGAGADLALAAALLTRVPVRLSGVADTRRALQAAWAYPLVGAAIGAVAGGVYTAALGLAMPALVGAGLCLAVTAMLTGALHEDGLADCADGLFGGTTPQRRLEILRDSRLGSFGALALGLVLLIRAGAIAATAGWLAVPVLVAAHAGGRWLMLLPAAIAVPARPDGLATGLAAGPAAAPDRPRGWWRTLGPSGLVALPLLLPAGLAAGTAAGDPVRGLIAVAVGITAAAAVALWLARLARRRLGGYTGDVLGAAEQLSEAALLVTMIAVLA